MHPPDPAAVERVVQQALDRPVAERTTYVAEACGGDDVLRNAVEALLAQEDSQFLRGDALGVAAAGMAAAPASLTGARVGPYEVGPLIGRGGMGEVYRARDTKLGRQVALKVLPDAFVTDHDRRMRFEREARLLASLSHPNIAVVYGLEQSHGTEMLVLELIEGDTLADRLTHGALPARAAVTIGIQLAEALEAAHGQGVIHRDLKPANIKVRPDGTVKVLDFGLAKAVAVEAHPVDVSQSPTMSSPTRHGVILGTAPYVSPEQARGESADARADIWAFGVVLFELLTGRQLFDGPTTSDVLAAVLTRAVPWAQLPRHLHPRVRLMLERCLERDPRNRYHAIADARVDLQTALADPRGVEPAPEAPVVATSRRRWVAGFAVVAAAALVTWALARAPAAEPAAVARFEHVFPPTTGALLQTGQPTLAMAPDGTRFAFAGMEGLYVRALDDLEAHVVAGTEGGAAIQPFFSPDGQRLGYWDRYRRELRTVPVEGGSSTFVASVPGNPGGPSWQADGTILYSQEDLTRQSKPTLWRVLARGGPPAPLFENDSNVTSPEVLPDGDTMIYAVGPVRPGGDRQVTVRSLASGRAEALFPGTTVSYLSSGHLVYALGSDLVARTFDLETWAVGEPVVMETVLRANEVAAPQYALSPSGDLVYAAGDSESLRRSLVVTTLDGDTRVLGAQQKPYLLPSVSPDGNTVAVQVTEGGESQIWLYELSGESEVRQFTFEGNNQHPSWTPDGAWIVFSSDRDGVLSVYRQRADAGGLPERLTVPEDGRPHRLPVLAPDGSLFTALATSPDVDIGMVRANSVNRVPELAISGAGNQLAAAVSPDGRWIAYQSQEAGIVEVYVRPLPLSEEKHRVTEGGAVYAVWSRDGKQLFYVGREDYQIAVVDVSTTPSFSVRNRRRLPITNHISARYFDTMPDGRLLTIGTADARIVVVQNWIEEVKARVH